jgi:hypothetical protein
MAKRKKYDFERLEKYCQENNVVLLEDYSNFQLTGLSNIKSRCVYENCINNVNKRFIEFEKTGSYCINCIKIIRNEKIKKSCLEKYGVENVSQIDKFKASKVSQKYTYDLLQNYCTNNNINLCNNYENEKLNCNFFIKGFCSNGDCLNVFNKKFYKLINTNGLCNSCIFKNAKEVRNDTNIKNIGTSNYFQCELIKNKIKETNVKKYGFKHASQNENVKNKCKTTCLLKYGVSHHSHNKNVQNKITQTNLSRYGVEHLMKNPDYLENMLKKSHKFKNYILPSGKIIKYQGYENIALNELIINEKNNESNIITGCKNVPTIFYIDDNKRQRVHFVDIYIPSQNKCIEVKSTWTFIKPNVLNKQKAAKDLGYNYEIWVYDKKGNKTCYY